MRIKIERLLVLLLLFFSPFAFGQNTPATLVKGVVKGDNGALLARISVMEKGTSNAVITDEQGAYSIQVKTSAILVFTGVGFEKLELKASSTDSWNVTLKSEAKTLSDVVVVGYGSQKKTKITGAVSTVKMDEILGERPVSTTSSLLQGIVPGLQVTIPSGRPGEAGSLNIRGATGFGSALNSSIATGAPLILVDNTVFDMPLTLIDPNDIESVTILKDAGAAAIYGARSAFGVILIQTKKGQKNQKTQFNYSNNFIFSKPSRHCLQIGS